MASFRRTRLAIRWCLVALSAGSAKGASAPDMQERPLREWASRLQTSFPIRFVTSSTGEEWTGPAAGQKSLRFLLERSTWAWPDRYRVDHATFLREPKDNRPAPEESDWASAIERTAASRDSTGSAMNFGGSPAVEKFSDSQPWSDKALESSFRNPWIAAQWIASESSPSKRIRVLQSDSSGGSFMLDDRAQVRIRKDASGWVCDQMTFFDDKSRIRWECEYGDFRRISGLEGLLPFWRTEVRPSAKGLETLRNNETGPVELGPPVFHATLSAEVLPALDSSVFILTADEAREAFASSRRVWKEALAKVYGGGAKQTGTQRDSSTPLDSATLQPPNASASSDGLSGSTEPRPIQRWAWVVGLGAIAFASALLYVRKRQAQSI